MNTDPLIGRQLANFRIERVLGRGGMAQVYYGQDVKLDRPVAIKVIDARHRGKPAYAQRFVKEARAVARWRHESIIQIYYADDQDDLYFYAMEYIDGQDLASILAAYSAQGELMPQQDVLRVTRAIASALDYAHKHKVIHRDIKPSNVMVSDDGRIVLGDFGLALDMQEGSSGEAFGTPHYISPEQARRSSDVVPQSDLYSLGIILYEMLTGVVPFDDPSPTSVALQHITQPPPAPRSLNPQLGEAVEKVLLKAIGKLPQDRYQTGAALVADLQSALALEQAGPEKPAVLPLPAMPAGIITGQKPTVARRQGAASAPEAATQASAESASRPKRGNGFLAAFLLFCLLSLLAASWFFPDLLPFSLPTVALPAATETVSAPQPTHTAPPAPTVAATLALSSPSPVILDTATLPPTETRPPMPTATASAIPTEMNLTPAPTVKYFNGQRMWMFYDSSGFYLYNASENNRSISQFAFERLDINDEILNSFGGWQWESIYRVLHPDRCMRLEIRKSPDYLRPEACGNRFLASFTYGSDDEFIFWTENPASTQFRVLWEKEEVGRCEIAAGFCEVFIP
jgi:serine/threonine protein kinase